MANEHLLVGKWWCSGCSATSEHLRPRKENYVLFIQEPLLIIENGFAMLLASFLVRYAGFLYSFFAFEKSSCTISKVYHFKKKLSIMMQSRTLST